jgi:predicted CoA-substrate-specific enzyme activase
VILEILIPGGGKMAFYLGVDLGSVSAKTAVLDEECRIVLTAYERHHGRPMEVARAMLREVLEKFPAENISGAALTGFSPPHDDHPYLVLNEILCQARAAAHFYPDTRSVIEMGGQDSKLIILSSEEENGRPVIRDFAMNSICAAGTGSFLDQQASRLRIDIDGEFGELASRSARPPRIAGRCSVFAKSDMIHLQQQAAPIEDILAGLCFAVARNFVSSIARGCRLESPVAFHGGVASNAGMARAFREVLSLGPADLRIHEHHRLMGAIGGALLARDEGPGKRNSDAEGLLAVFNAGDIPIETCSPLAIVHSRVSSTPPGGEISHEDCRAGYLGIDVGSISTNLAVIAEDGRVLAKKYLMTAGRPIEAVKAGLLDIRRELKDAILIRGVCTTGSGRYLTGDFFGADLVKNEITAQATAAVSLDPSVDTIFEIGGQDSKYISLSSGAVVDFEMNKVCAAGTGSFLEEQAEKLGISIKREFAAAALKARKPCAMGERCTVFMESDLLSNQRRGAPTGDLAAGLCYSIAQNYLNKVVGDRPVGRHIFFQGGTAFNDGVVAAFEAVTGKKITVPNHHEVTGAIGCALLARKWHRDTGGETKFKGFTRGEVTYKQDSFECASCPNHCEINRVRVPGESPLFYGGRCEKYEVRRGEKNTSIPDLFMERENLLLREFEKQRELPRLKGTVGIPRVLYNLEYLPFWVRLFSELGYRVVLSDPTNKSLINTGLKTVLSEACFPVKVAHGHLANLLEKKADFIFLPSITGLKAVHPEFPETAPCPYGQALPYILRAAFDLDRRDDAVLLTPVISFSWSDGEIARALSRMDGIKASNAELRRAVGAAREAQDEFHAALKNRGKEILDTLTVEDRAVVIVSRPYNGCDSGINLDLPGKLKDLGALPIPMDFLPLDEEPLGREWPFMTWGYGQKFLSAAEIIRRDRRLNALFITNFGCGPDSFLMKFFRKRMGGKLYLQIEVDEHSADAGALTRCEAFLDSLENASKDTGKYTLSLKRFGKNGGGRTLYIPAMCDHAHAVRAAFEACGIRAEVLPESDKESLALGRRHTSGKECYPCIVTTGDLLRLVKSPGFDPRKSAFFMPSAGGGCRFGYYNILHRIVLDELGYHDVPIYAPSQTDDFLAELGEGAGRGFFRLAWNGVVAADLLDKALRETRPYEKNPGETEKVYRICLEAMCRAVAKRKDLLPLMREAREAFSAIPLRRETRPVIGVVGEIFVRSHRFSNNRLVEELERLGAEAWVAPFSEWMLYLNETGKEDRLRQGNLPGLAGLSLADWVARRDETRLLRAWDGFLRSGHEPSAAQSIRAGSAYVHPSFRGESILSLGKAVDFHRGGLAGVINVMPFTCMPGTVVNALLPRLKEDCGGMPFLNIAYDGLDHSNNLLRLSAFIHQCRQFMETGRAACPH